MMNQLTFKQGLFLLLMIIGLTSCQEKKLTVLNTYLGSNSHFGMDIVPIEGKGSIIGTQLGTLIRLTNETENNVLWEKKDKIEEDSNGYALAKGFNNDVYVVGGMPGGNVYINLTSGHHPLIMKRYKIDELDKE